MSKKSKMSILGQSGTKPQHKPQERPKIEIFVLIENFRRDLGHFPQKTLEN
jgi:hypothetical protein